VIGHRINGDLATLADLDRVRPGLVGLDPHDLNGLTRVVYAAFGTPDTGAVFPAGGDKARATAIGAFEVAFLDLQAQAAGLPLHALLGGAVRERVAFSAYLFYRFAAHRDAPDPADPFGEAIQTTDRVPALTDREFCPCSKRVQFVLHHP
jgi:glucarate dehydratase